MTSHATELHRLLLRIKAVTEATSVSRTQIYRLMKRGEFPQSHRISEGVTCWLASDIHEWVKKRTGDM